MSNKAVVAIVATAAIAGGLYLVNKRYGKKIRDILSGTSEADVVQVKEPLLLTHEKETK